MSVRIDESYTEPGGKLIEAEERYAKTFLVL